MSLHLGGTPGPHLPHPKQLQGGRSTSSGALQSVPHSPTPLAQLQPPISPMSQQMAARRAFRLSSGHVTPLPESLSTAPGHTERQARPATQPSDTPDLAQSVPNLARGDPSGEITAPSPSQPTPAPHCPRAGAAAWGADLTHCQRRLRHHQASRKPLHPL